MNTLIIHDNTGYIIDVRSGEPTPREPVGVPFLWAEIPEGKYVESVDVSVTPHKAVFKDRPLSEIDILKDENVKIKESMAELAELILGGM